MVTHEFAFDQVGEAFDLVADSGPAEATVDSVERVLRKTGVLKALGRAQWMP